MSGLRLGVVVNPTAGGGRGRLAGREVLHALAARGHTVEDLSADTRAAALDRARAAAAAGLDALVVVGGDGMANLGVAAVAGTDVPLGLVPAGTGDDIARALGLPRRGTAGAVAALEAALGTGGRHIDAVDVRPAGGTAGAATRYVCVLSAGFDARVNARANALRFPRGTARYVRALLHELGGFVPYGYRVTLDDRTWEGPGTLVAVANAPSFGGGMRVAPAALLDDGLLDVVVAGPLDRRGVLGLLPRVYAGTHLRHPAVEVHRSRTVVIEATSAGAAPPEAFADGEPAGHLPLHLEVVPGAVRVLAPPQPA